MSDTNPNAYRTEAAEKRTQSIQLANEADALEAQADELEGKPPVTPTPETELPAGGEIYAPAEETKPSKIPFKK